MQQPFVSPVLQHLEAQRCRGVAELARHVGMTALVVGAIAGTVAFVYRDELVQIAVPLAFGAVLPLVVAFVLSGRKLKEYRTDFKKKIIAALVKRIAPQLDYQPASGMAEDEYDRSHLFAHERTYARYSSEDIVLGEAGGVRIRFSEVHSQSRHTTHSRNGTSTYYKTVFRGVLFRANAAVGAQAPVLALPRRFGFWRKRLKLSQELSLTAVKTGDAAFDRAFKVFAASEADLARALPPERRAAVVAFGAGLGGRLRLSFTGTGVYVALAVTRDLLEPPVWTSAEKIDAERYARQIRPFVELPKILRLKAADAPRDERAA